MPDRVEASARRSRLASRFPEKKLDVLVVSHGPNVRYLTGYTGSNGLLLLFADGRAAFFTDPRYAIQAGRETTCLVKIVRGPLLAAAAKLLARKRFRHLGFEKTHLPWEDYNTLSKALPLKGVLDPIPGWVE